MANHASGDQLPHLPVLYNEIIHALRPTRDGRYVDGTVGAGGHAWGILQASSPNGLLLGMDLDPTALKLAGERLDAYKERVTLVHSSYVDLDRHVKAMGWEAVDGIVLDLGLSSMQLDTPERGFSFQAEAPLDMRFDPQGDETAADLVNDLPEADLANLIYRYGEERQARRIARAIVRARPITSTRHLAQVIGGAVGGRGAGGGRIDPATLTFQALRIAVNRELEAVEAVLPMAVRALEPGGRLAVIAFHSLEDRLVKQFMRLESQDCICPPRQPVCTCGHRASIREITRRPMRATENEMQANPRARSARLRVAEKLAPGPA